MGFAQSGVGTLEHNGLALVRWDASGELLDPDYSIKLLNYVARLTKERRDPERQEEEAKRLELYNDPSKSDEYYALVREQLEADQKV